VLLLLLLLLEHVPANSVRESPSQLTFDACTATHSIL
jgi:hypothetical protein